MEEIIQILESGKANIRFEVSGEDLKLFAEALINRGIDQAKYELQKEEQFLTKKEVMTLFGVCDTTLWHWQRSGYLIPRKMGRKILYSKAEVLKLLGSR